MQKKFLIAVCGLLLLSAVLTGVFLFSCEDDWCFVTEWQKVKAADSFERCVSLGFPVMESYPRQCRAGDKLFVENVAAPLTTPPSAAHDERIRVHTPTPNALIQSPFLVSGEARGSWYFEASFPVRLLDGNDEELAILPAQAQSEWMTPEFVPFELLLKWNTPKTKTGKLVLMKDNPSGLPEYDASVSIPVRFALYQGATGLMRTVELYYYNGKMDQDASGNAQCTSRGLVPVERTIVATKTPIQDTLRLFLLGLIEAGERQKGIDTEYPLTSFTLQSAALSDGVLTLEFSDPLNLTSGGACRSAILRMQIEATIKQFPEVKEVKIVPVDLFQP
ncbi:MAG: Gmad2 immunoglobulin-like domain-containing protein [bacterium]|nr:Gmad2 immunoglobulin-like domain-containing protein [bacterium]